MGQRERLGGVSCTHSACPAATVPAQTQLPSHQQNRRPTFMASPTDWAVLNLISSGGLAGPASGPWQVE